MSYDFEIAAARPPDPAALRDAIALPDLRGFPAEGEAPGWPEKGLRLFREGLSTRLTEVDWADGKLTVVVRALATREDGELAVRLAEAAARRAGAAQVKTDYYGTVDVAELRRLHPAEWMDEQADSGTRMLASLIRDGKGPMSMPGPRRSCWIGPRMLAQLESARPDSLARNPRTGSEPPAIGSVQQSWTSPDANQLPARVLATLRRVQWEIPAGFRDAGVFIAGETAQTRFAVWLPGENLIIPRVDHVALRVTAGEVLMVPFAAVAELAGANGELLDECQLLVRATSAEAWAEIVARARPLASKPRRQ